ncbi:hypothetical protein [Edaphobacter aggregans]|uniref:hypothetical protein n=1 Tax=Edaphobacter aggregans TaxID=570835 RepID=UPI000551D728|nr:hypothetical protein [Edaphobacter aggregans]
MSTVESSMECPQCAGEAWHTFDCRESSSLIGCNYCGYTEYHGPEYGHGFKPTGRWIDEMSPGFGVLKIQGSASLRVVTILRCSTEEEFSEALALPFRFLPASRQDSGNNRRSQPV